MPISPEINQAISSGRVCLVPGPESHEGLARAILRAWQDDGYKQRLLSFPTNATQISKRDYESTREALREVGVDPDLPNLVVLTPYQFAELVQAETIDRSGPYRGRRLTDVVLVLPEPFGLKRPQDVQTAMVAATLGI
jgi:hypothetical protein